ncbi:NADPH-dependent glutamate synthase [Treponema sp.]
MNYENLSKEALELAAFTALKDIDAKKKSGTVFNAKARMAIPVQIMPTQDAIERGKTVSEVALGYSEAQAKLEAERCLGCKNEPCVRGCPVGVPIPRFIAEIQKGDYKAAVDAIKETNLLPAVCGRVCPQEKQCQLECTVGKGLKSIDKAVAIGRLERFVADWERENNRVTPPSVKPKTGKKVAVIGSGPAGITVAADVAREGHEVTLFEAFHKTGGVMVYGIPEFRLPKSIVQAEVDVLEKMGVKIQTNFLVGRTRTIKQLMEEDGFDAAFVGVGAGLPKFMGIEGENLVGVFSANEYLTRANLMKAYDADHSATPIYRSKIVSVIGGGNVAMDAARMALRLGAEQVHVIYRRTRDEMPARGEEVEHAMEEGIVFDFLRNPNKILDDGKGRVIGMEVQKFELGEADASGRRSPVPMAGSEFIFDCDTVIVALGNESNPLLVKTTEGLIVDKKGRIQVGADRKDLFRSRIRGGRHSSWRCNRHPCNGRGPPGCCCHQ